MYGSLTGNITAVLYFLLYQICGIMIADYFFNKEKAFIRILIGSTSGSFLLQWIPAITSMLFGFNNLSHMAALGLLTALLIIIAVINMRSKEKAELLILNLKTSFSSAVSFLKENLVFILLFIILTVFFGMLLNSHVLPAEDGALYAGQCTYGDMNMHLGFITSIANQGKFPPDYSIMPGQRLCYPFLCDSISSSMYLWGCSLKTAYCLPMIFAFMQVLGGLYAFAFAWLKDRAKAITAWVLFFLNGGFGFLYFLNVIGNKTHSISEIFTEFYHTPTNFVDYNVRWSNVVADMLLPQRATLFGWAVLFPLLFILYKANFEKKTRYFYYAGVLAGGLVMIHTHSFLALGIVCAVWLLFYLADLCGVEAYSVRLAKGNTRITWALRAVFICVSILIMSFLRNRELENAAEDHTTFFLTVGLIGVSIGAGIILGLLLKLLIAKKAMPVLKTWGSFLLIVMPLALMQLFTWTFKQATGDQFVRGQFNWANIDDGYLTFYIKNIGLVMLFIIFALIISDKKNFRFAMSGLAIWFIAEFLGFQPNKYDNNKLLYVGFIFLIITAASVMVDLYRMVKIKAIAVILAVAVMSVCTVSAVLTLGREYVSNYQLFPREYVDLVDYINDSDIPADAVILTHNNHNNAVASLTGRNIVIGTGTFLYYHGFDITERVRDVKNMFENPADHLALFKKYDVGYAVIGSQETNNYTIDYEWFDTHSAVLYQENGAALLKLEY